jgi:hypothetical protein
LRVMEAPDKCGSPQKLSVCTRTRRADVQLQGVSAALVIGHLPYETWVIIIRFHSRVDKPGGSSSVQIAQGVAPA